MIDCTDDQPVKLRLVLSTVLRTAICRDHFRSPFPFENVLFKLLTGLPKNFVFFKESLERRPARRAVLSSAFDGPAELAGVSTAPACLVPTFGEGMCTGLCGNTLGLVAGSPVSGARGNSLLGSNGRCLATGIGNPVVLSLTITGDNDGADGILPVVYDRFRVTGGLRNSVVLFGLASFAETGVKNLESLLESDGPRLRGGGVGGASTCGRGTRVISPAVPATDLGVDVSNGEDGTFGASVTVCLDLLGLGGLGGGGRGGLLKIIIVLLSVSPFESLFDPPLGKISELELCPMFPISDPGPFDDEPSSVIAF